MGSVLSRRAFLHLTMTALKGAIINDAIPERVNPLRCDWMQIIFGAHVWDTSKVYNSKWALHLYNLIPATGDVAKAMQHDSYDGWWLLGHNEPELNGVEPDLYAQTVTLQKLAVTAADPNAKFCVSCGSWLHPCYENNSWFAQMWALLPGATRKRIYALDTHFYSTGGTTPQSDIFLKAPINDYLSLVRTWLGVAHPECGYIPTVSQDSNLVREVWLTEIGLYNDAYVQAHAADADQYPVKVQNVADKYCARWAWYSMSANNGYRDLWNGTLTPIGMTFAGL